MENQKLIDELYLCATECDTCYNSCLREENKHELRQCMMLDQDCEAICRLAMLFLERMSENSWSLLKLCAEICEKCAAECEKHAHMEHCRRCAEVCKRCAEMCKGLVMAH